jgi:prephenate dehydrogenase
MDIRQVAVIGVDCISTSIALALKAQKEPPEIVGYDADAVAADLARAQGALDRVTRKPDRACRDAELIIVAVPVSAVRDTFAAIAPHLRPGCLVTDTAHLKGPVIRWAEELLPDNVFFAGGHIIPNPAIVGFDPLEGLEAASADLLKEALYCFVTPGGTSSSVIDALSALAEALGAHHYFIDAVEHDGLQAGVEGLPDLLALALLRTTIDAPGWQEMRKFAGHRFAVATHDAADAYERSAALFLNREHVVRRLNLLLRELIYLRDLLSQEDTESVEQALIDAAEGRDRWIAEREQGMWVNRENLRGAPISTAGQQIGQMIFGERLSRRLTAEPKRRGD